MSLSLNGRHLKPKIPLCPPPPPLQLSRFQYTAKNEKFGDFTLQVTRKYICSAYEGLKNTFRINLRNEHDLLYFKHSGFTLALIFMV